MSKYDPYFNILGQQEEKQPDYSGFGYAPVGTIKNTVDQGSSAPSAGEQTAELGTTAATGAMMGGPAGAAVAVGGQLLTQYIAQKAADERARRERAAQIAEQHGQAEQHGYDSLINVYKSALGGR